MKCWKCGREIPENTSVCTYCSASMHRKAPVTAAGKAMRQIYDRFGCERIFDKKSILTVALGDVLEDSKKLRNQLEMVMSTGVGNVYANQLRNIGKPDAAFNSKVKTLIVEEAGLSERIAAELMGYFDEMIGWNNGVQTTTQTGGGATSRPNPTREIPRPTPNREIPRPTPNPTKPPVDEPKIPLPTAAVPVHNTGCGFVLLVGGGVCTLIAGMIPLAIGFFVLAAIAVYANSAEEKAYYPKKLSCNRTDTAIILTWDDHVDKFAIAVGNKWVLTGSGRRAVLTGDMFAHCKPGERFTVTLAQIVRSDSVITRGKIELQHPKK